MALFSGGHDWLADPKDVSILRSDIRQAIVYDKTLNTYNHLSFVWGNTAYSDVYDEIIAQIKQIEFGN